LEIVEGEGDYNAFCAPVVGLGDSMEALLACSVPDLYVYTLPLEFYLFLLKIYAEGIDVGLMDLVVHVAGDKGCLANT
jgi:hypothetical protein